jgi:hypothetical protein
MNLDQFGLLSGLFVEKSHFVFELFCDFDVLVLLINGLGGFSLEGLQHFDFVQVSLQLGFESLQI